MTPTPIVSSKDLRRTYGEGEAAVHALAGVTVAFPAGELTAIMGPSGSGKSTLMHLLAGLDRPTSGTVTVDGTELGALDDDALTELRREKIGFVFQAFNLLSRTTALENVELPLIYAGIRAKERHRRSQEALTRVGLGDRGHHIPSQLSGGQQQRVAIARSLVNRPSLLLADEPTGNLDSRTSVDIMQVFQELNQGENLTIVMVTHEPDIADFAKRIITFRDGRILKDERVAHRRIASEVIARMPALED